MVVHNFVLLLKDLLRRLIDTRKLWFLGYISLDLAKKGYEIQDGARSLARTVENTIEAEVFRKLHAKPELIKDEDNQSLLEQCVCV